MKDIFKNGVVVLLIIAVLYIIFLRECKRPVPCPAEDKMIVKKADWKSMVEAANKPATVHIDTVYIKGDVIYITSPLPVPDPEDIITYTYSDSIVNKQIDVRYDFRSEGKLLERKWTYKPIETVINRIDSIPYPVYIKGDAYEVKVSQRGLYLYGSAGGNEKAFLFGGGLDYITKKSTELGYQYQRFGDENFHSVKVGVKLFNKNK